MLNRQKESVYSFQLGVLPDLGFMICNKALWNAIAIRLCYSWREKKTTYILFLNATSTLET